MKYNTFHWQASLVCLTLNLIAQSAGATALTDKAAGAKKLLPASTAKVDLQSVSITDGPVGKPVSDLLAASRSITASGTVPAPAAKLHVVPDAVTAEELAKIRASLDVLAQDSWKITPPQSLINKVPVVDTPALKDTAAVPDQLDVAATPATMPVPDDLTAAQAAPTQSSTAVTSKLKIISPTADELFDVPAVTVVIQFSQDAAVDLLINGVAADPSLVGRTETDPQTGLMTQSWYGVSLTEGENTIVLRSQSNPQDTTTVIAQVRGAVQKLTIDTREAQVPADGKSMATVRGKLLDAQGNIASREALVTLTATAGDFVGEDAEPAQPGFQVQAINGEFTAQLQAGLAAQTVRIKAFSTNLEAYTQVEFETDLRPSIATGVLDLRFGRRGTDFYRSVREFLPLDEDNRYRLDVNASIFATGKVGQWLFTGAFNNARNLNQDCKGESSLFRQYQACDHNYPIYGDSSNSTVLAPSKDSVYLKLERTSPVANAGSDFFMWGDFNTEEFVTKSQEFTATTRQLHGLKANYNIGNLQLSGMYGNNIQGYQRDLIPPDGTSGTYFFSRRRLVAGSEEIYLEMEELNRPGTVIDRQRLNRGPDYEIDYDRGTIVFREPVLRTDVGQAGETLVRRIVASYQYDNPGVDSDLIAGRLRYFLSRTPNQESWIGGTYLRENQGERGFDILGADAYISLGENGSLIAEYARSNNDFSGVNVSGSAYRVDLQGQVANGVQGRVYLRSAAAGFANNATTSFIPGQTRYGALATAAIGPTTNLRAQYDRETNKGIAPNPVALFEDLFTASTLSRPGTAVDNALTTISLGIQQKLGSADVNVDWLHRDRTDRLGDLNSNSDQLRSRLTLPLAKRLTLLAQNETTLSSSTDAVFGDRSLFGLNWEAMPGLNLQLAQQFFHRGQFAGKSITSFNIFGDRKLGPDTTLKGRYSVFTGANDMTMQGAIGLNQKLQISPGLRMDLGYERVFSTLSSKAATGRPFTQPFAFGSSSAGLGLVSGDNYNVGLEYSENQDFQASVRYEGRASTSGNNTVLTAGATGRLSPAITSLMRYQKSNAANQAINSLGDTVNLKLGLAYRSPDDDRFNALLRYEYRKNGSTIPDTILFGTGTGSRDHLFGLEAIYAPSWQWEFYGKFALRSSTTYLAQDLVGTSLVTLAQARATYRFNQSWDLTGEARWWNQANLDSSEMAFSADVGYYLTPNLRASVGYGFGRVKDRDFGDDRSSGGLFVGLTVKLNELFDGFGLQKVPEPESKTAEERAKAVAASRVKITPAAAAVKPSMSQTQPSSSGAANNAADDTSQPEPS
ncbi:TonB-dependent receptor [filamentous cyanobacterium LEGE 11480]|uniref:TonB-dependent receptor n=1 Tax=Romeriopsis navalis LEGE 11480 TaxID=2777977 RepID=A0A928VHT0_9CYAN|nr:TonB-dependent receptor [Romeriopsis navalis]MBE9028858.1 TonB-dependent receptor [Romeriopsis navalis LEGE 11480]